MSNKKEIIEALKILKSREVILLHCISSYPTPRPSIKSQNI